jgi:hypothetical protein
MTLAELILAAMLSLQPAGRSSYSAVAVEPGVVCDTEYTRGCRRETEEEGRARYAVVAQAIAEVSGGSRDLAARILAVVHGESGMRKDVHSGVGKHAKGDRGRSCGVGQRLLGDRGATHRGFRCADIVGLDIVSTRRAIVTIADDLTRARGYCARIVGTTDFACAVACYGGLPTHSKDKRIRARVRSYERARQLLNKPVVEVVAVVAKGST